MISCRKKLIRRIDWSAPTIGTSKPGSTLTLDRFIGIPVIFCCSCWIYTANIQFFTTVWFSWLGKFVVYMIFLLSDCECREPIFKIPWGPEISIKIVCKCHETRGWEFVQRLCYFPHIFTCTTLLMFYFPHIFTCTTFLFYMFSRFYPVHIPHSAQTHSSLLWLINNWLHYMRHD